MLLELTSAHLSEYHPEAIALVRLRPNFRSKPEFCTFIHIPNVHLQHIYLLSFSPMGTKSDLHQALRLVVHSNSVDCAESMCPLQGHPASIHPRVRI